MSKIKQPSVAGSFYTDDRAELISQIKSFEEHALKDYSYKSRAIIVPHAGYVYSGQLAEEGYNNLSPDVKNIFIFSPSHYARIFGCTLSDDDGWQTPLGVVEINTEIVNELHTKFGCEYFEEAFDKEHAVEVQLPFIQTFFPDAKIIPVLTGCESPDKISSIIEYYWQNEENGFVISSDLSHFYPSKEAKKIDEYTAEMIEANDVKGFEAEQACGAVGICGLVNFSKNNNFSMIRVGLINSGDITADTSRVVGYGSWFLYEGTKPEFIKKQFSDFVLDLCKKSIAEEALPKVYPAVFDEKGASFVTLEIDGQLRGCIGSIIAHQPLIKDIEQNAFNAAYSDPRFPPLRNEEFDKVSIAVSILSKPVKIKFKNEVDLLNQIRKNVDGLIIKDGSHQAVYLPSVWEQLRDKRIFLNSLKQKAGLSPDYFSDHFEVQRFTTEYIK